MKWVLPKRNECAGVAVAFVAILAAAGSALAQAPGVKGFDDFQLVKTRNIFDSSRRGGRSEGSRDSRSMVQIVRANTLSLTGTMVTDGRTLAFFSGSRSENSKVIGVGETVADYKVKSIAATQVELEKDGKPTSLAVGKMLTLEGTTTEEVAAPTTAPGVPTGDPSATAPTADTATAPSNDKNDVLRRMMERRAKEMNK